jgi:hypothetical protein
LSLTVVRLLAPHLTEANHRELLAAAGGCGKREVEELIARHFPRPDVAALVRKVAARQESGPEVTARPDPASTVAPPGPHAVFGTTSSGQDVASRGEPSAPRPSVIWSTPPAVTPLAPDRYAFRFTGDAAIRDKLRQAQDLLRHAVPSGDPAAIFDRALTLLLADLARKRGKAIGKPPTEASSRSLRAKDAAHATPVVRATPMDVEQAVGLATRSGTSVRPRGAPPDVTKSAPNP